MYFNLIRSMYPEVIRHFSESTLVLKTAIYVRISNIPINTIPSNEY
jgi:hypothetical protein